MALSPAPALAAFTNVTDYFQLDRNVAQPAGSTRDDWNSTNPGGASVMPDSVGKLVRRTFVSDPAPLTVFAGGGSKDDLDLSGAFAQGGGWKHKSGSVPDKDNITNAYAAAYNIEGDLVIYAGADRFDNSGDAFMGFWFFKSAISLNANGTFSGRHTNGDVLVLANFTGGGTTVTIQVLEWSAPGGTINGTLKLLAGDTVTSATCGSSVSPYYCGTANIDAGEVPNWAYTNKDGTQAFQAAGFLELGVNISKLLLLAGDTSAPCFSSFMAETRSSSSVDAVLKDFALGNFDVCGVDVTKACPSGAVGANGASIDYAFNGKITNTGFGALTNLALIDTPQPATPPATVSSNYTFFNCGTGAVLQTGSATFTGTLPAGAELCYASTFNTTANGSTNTIQVVANTGPTTTTSDTSDTVTCPTLNFPTGLQVTKVCTASLAASSGLLVVKVDVSGSICNLGNLAVTSLTAIDQVVGMSSLPALTLQATALGAKGTTTECTTYTGAYFPSAPDPGKTTQFSDTVRARAVPPPITGVSEVTATVDPGATCDLCPSGSCSTADGTSLRTMMRAPARK